jgi:hypothetical protein
VQLTALREDIRPAQTPHHLAGETDAGNLLVLLR